MARDRVLEHLHPTFREKYNRLTQMLTEENLPFRMFEGFRSPERQANLYAKGRTKPGSIVTKAKPWSSYHQYGVACDFVLYIDGKWSWDDKGDRARWWARLHELAKMVGLQPLSWEKPHLQIQGLSLSDLRAGRYPTGGDDGWAENLEEAIESWLGHPQAPPLPHGQPQRPPIVPGPADDEEKPDTHAASGGGGKRYRVVARRGLRLREGASQKFDIVDVLPLNRVVQVLKVVGDWYLVDVEGDGIADGYCFGDYLIPED